MYRRYQQFNSYRPRTGNAVIGLIAATGGFFFLQMIAPGLADSMVLDPRVALPQLKLYQLVTYIFLHGGFFHLFINLFVLYMFGRELEVLWGSSKFLFYYFFSGIGAGLITALFSNYPVVGASGAIYGLLLAFGVIFPNRILLLGFLIPVKAKYAVIIFGAIEFFTTMGGTGDGIAHITHLGGMIFGGLLLAIWHFKKSKPKKRRVKGQVIDMADLHGGASSPANVDRILDKVLRQGVDSLTEDERDILIRAGKFYDQQGKRD